MGIDWPPVRRAAHASGLFACSHPDCGKSFLREEHLNRHLLVYTFSRPHKCFICSRSFARMLVWKKLSVVKTLANLILSNIITRHVLRHNEPPDGAKRTSLDCQICRRRKIMCSFIYVCSACADLSESCVRDMSSVQAISSMTRGGRVNSHSAGEESIVGEASEGDRALDVRENELAFFGASLISI